MVLAGIPIGVAYAQTGEYDKARRIFGIAAGCGCENARHNLGQVAGVVDQL